MVHTCQPVRQGWHRRCPQGWMRVSLSRSAQILHSWKVLPISQYSSYCSCWVLVVGGGLVRETTQDMITESDISGYDLCFCLGKASVSCWQFTVKLIKRESASVYFCNFDFAPLGWCAQACQVGVHITAIWVQVAAGTDTQSS